MKLCLFCVQLQISQMSSLDGSPNQFVLLSRFATVKSPVVAEERWFTMNNYYRTICQTFKPVFQNSCLEPQIFLTLDTNFNGDRIVVESYSVTSVSLSSEFELIGTIKCRVLAIKLTKVPVEVSASHTENEVLQPLLGAEEVCIME